MLISTPKGINIKSAIPRKFKWGIAGCGKFAEYTFLPALQTVKRSKLVSIFSHDSNRSKEIAFRFGAPNYFSDYNEFLKSDIEAVYISGITANHHEQVIKAAKAGKHILCERPLALTSHQASEMIDVCKKNNVLLVVDHLHRFHPHIIKTKELIDKQLLGKIVSISASYHIGKTPDNNFRFKKDLSGGGVLRDLGSQMIDLLRYFGGEIVEVKGFMDNIIYNTEVEDYSSAILKFEKSGYGHFDVSYNSKKSLIHAVIIGHNGSITLESFIDKRNVSSKLIIDLHGEAKKVFRKRITKISFMIKSVQKSFMKNQTPLVTGEDGLANLKIIEEIERQSLNK